MTKHLLKNKWIITFCICLLLKVQAQTVIYTTDFGTVPNVNPTGWTFTGLNMNISNNTASSGYSGASGNAYLGEGNSVAFINTSGTSEPSSQSGTSVATLSLSTSGYPLISLSFGMRKSSSGYNSNATYTLEWSSDGSTYNTISYTEATAGGWGLASGSALTLPAGAGNQAALYVRWTFVRTGTSSNFKIDDVAVTGNTVSANSSPTIDMDVAVTTNYLDGSITVSPASPYTMSGVISDPTDPASISGIGFIIFDAQTSAGSLTVTATSSNTVVVPSANVVLTGSGALRNVKITSTGIGYSTITVNVSDGSNITPYIINYASSAAAATPSNTLWHTGMSDASDAIAIDDNYYISGDDELDVLNVYSRFSSGLPLVSFNYTSLVALPDPAKPETDIEASTTSPTNANKKYWLGSMSTGGSAFSVRPSRDCFLSTLISGTGAATTFSIVGYYSNLRSKLITWGDANGYNFSASAAAGVDSKSISGYAAEGMVFGPDNTTLYIGLRAPLVPVSNRINAVIAPITNFETWFNNGVPSGNPTIGAPIELNLGGRGFRDLIRLSNGTYIIIAGNSAGSPITSAVYKWTGNAGDIPISLNTSANGILNIEGVMPINNSSQLSMTQLQIISDGGGDILYGDGTASKDFTDLNLRKFRADNLTGIDLCLLPASATPTITQTGMALSSTIGSGYQWYYNNAAVNGAIAQTYTATQNGNYYVAVANSLGCVANSLPVTINSVGLENYLENENNLIAYPNPFTYTISLQLTLALNAKVVIEIYSVLGQKIATVADASYLQGIHTFNFGANSAGVYSVKTTVNDKVSISRIVQTN